MGLSCASPSRMHVSLKQVSRYLFRCAKEESLAQRFDGGCRLDCHQRLTPLFVEPS